MEPAKLTKYSASAGSGKTYKLTGIFLSRLFSTGSSSKKILAVTFTNKAAADMKRKILEQLWSISKGEKSDMLRELSEVTGKPEEKLVEEAGPVLKNLLHDYSSFNVGTIDSFFQKVLKAFTREIGLQQGYVIETDHSLILKLAVDETIEKSSKDKVLGRWLSEYSGERIEEGRSWNLRDDIVSLAEEIFSEKFRLITNEEKERLKDKEFLSAYLKDLHALTASFRKRIREEAEECETILSSCEVTAEMFLRGNSGGVPTFLRYLKESPDTFYKQPNQTISKTLETPPVFTAKAGPSPQLLAAFSKGFAERFIDLLNYYLSESVRVNTALFISRNIYVLGILSDILANIHEITTDQNKFLLSDSGELLWLIIKDDQTPFIYEKIGNYYEHFMIDEFQDTSVIQWNNFKPLIDNSLSQGFGNLVVGDVKQSIYRWRNSDWRIMGQQLEEQYRDQQLENRALEKNWRSKWNIVAFNNSLFTALPQLIDASSKNNTGGKLLGSLYTDTSQFCRYSERDGCVRISFINDDENGFNESVLERLPGLIEEIQDKGYRAGDIGILVRTNGEGGEVLKKLMQYAGTAGEKEKKYNFNVISNDSLLISSCPAIEFIVTVLSTLHSEPEPLYNALIVRTYLEACGKDPFSADLSDPVFFQRYLPPDTGLFLLRLRRASLFDSVEQIIRFFGLGEFEENKPYLEAFQGHVLEFSGNNSSDITLFLEWWNESGIKKSIILPENQDSIRIMTIHKSKGLEFKIVIVPFVSWNLGHGRFPPVLWLKPAGEPFNRLGIVPVKYRSDMVNSDFAEDYYNESYYSVIDNLNLLYVAFTRAEHCLFGFAPSQSGQSGIASILLQAFGHEVKGDPGKPFISLPGLFNGETGSFSLGEIPAADTYARDPGKTIEPAGKYYVNNELNRVHLKFYGKNWLMKIDPGRESRINYGRLMHQILESVNTLDDIPGTVEKMVLEGIISSNETEELNSHLKEALSAPQVSDWFRKGLKVLNEAEILTVGGKIKRPDRVIIDKDRVIVIDFKFGEEKRSHSEQVRNYASLLRGMGYSDVSGYIWYVDKGKVLIA